jgi:hypothetical protein
MWSCLNPDRPPEKARATASAAIVTITFEFARAAASMASCVQAVLHFVSSDGDPTKVTVLES